MSNENKKENKYIYAYQWSRTGRDDDWHLDMYARKDIDAVKKDIAYFQKLRQEEIAKNGSSQYAPYTRIVRKLVPDWEVVE